MGSVYLYFKIKVSGCWADNGCVAFFSVDCKRKCAEAGGRKLSRRGIKKVETTLQKFPLYHLGVTYSFE